MINQITPESLIDRGFTIHSRFIEWYSLVVNYNEITVCEENTSGRGVMISDLLSGGDYPFRPDTILLPTIRTLAQLDRIIAVVRGDE